MKGKGVDETIRADSDGNLSIQDLPVQGNQAHRLQIHRSYIFLIWNRRLSWGNGENYSDLFSSCQAQNGQKDSLGGRLENCLFLIITSVEARARTYFILGNLFLAYSHRDHYRCKTNNKNEKK